MSKMTQVSCEKKCGGCPCGWLGKKFLGICLGVWLILFAIVPHSARGVAWSVRAVSGLWDRGEAVITTEDRPRRRNRGQGTPPDFIDGQDRGDGPWRF